MLVPLSPLVTAAGSRYWRVRLFPTTPPLKKRPPPPHALYSCRWHLFCAKLERAGAIHRTAGKGVRHAGETNDDKSREGQARRKSTDDAGGRICPRRNRARPTGQARGAFKQTGDRHRPIESAPRGGQITAAEKGESFRANAKTSRARLQPRPETAEEKVVAKTLPRRVPRSAARRPAGGFETFVITPGKEIATDVIRNAGKHNRPLDVAATFSQPEERRIG